VRAHLYFVLAFLGEAQVGALPRVVSGLVWAGQRAGFLGSGLVFGQKL